MSTAPSHDMVDFETFLRKEGYHLNMAPEEARERIQDTFCSRSLNRFENLMEIRKERPYRPEEFYSVADTLEEAALLFSPLAHTTSACGQHLYRTIKPFLTPGIKVADMGCGVGSWTRWMAEHHPHVQFVGFDKHDGLLAIANTVHRQANCQFHECDYVDLSKAYGQYDLITSLLGVDFEPPVVAPDPDTLSSNDSTNNAMTDYIKRVFATVASGWKKILAPNGLVKAVLRLPSFEMWYGCVVGAANAGFKLNHDLSSCVAVGKQRFPLMVFETGEDPVVVDLDLMLGWWVDRTGASADAQVLLDAPALLRYRRLQNKKILDVSETKYDDGHYMHKETGLADGVGYVYEYATTFYRRLECIQESKLQDSSAPRFVAGADL
ncbi:MAG: methyltransferase domain-containing protein [Chlamydiales bacterium]|nr:methyltransferase domain-containing protein [Chlamydiales bacterium]